jgi:hypothetical protein
VPLTLAPHEQELPATLSILKPELSKPAQPHDRKLLR